MHPADAYDLLESLELSYADEVFVEVDGTRFSVQDVQDTSQGVVIVAGPHEEEEAE